MNGGREQSNQIVILRPRYYLDYFNQFIEQISNLYSRLLAPKEISFIEDYLKLSTRAQCLYIRLASRRGRYFKQSALTYLEISDSGLREVIAELVKQKWISNVVTERQKNADEEFFCLFTKAELLETLRAADSLRFVYARKLRKADLVACLLAWPDRNELGEQLALHYRVICRERDEVLNLFKFLYFGHLDGDFTAFILRDLGHSRFEERLPHQLSARFTTREQLEETYFAALAYQHFKDNSAELPATELYAAFKVWQSWRRAHFNSPTETANVLIEKWALRLATFLEKQKSPELALDIYAETTRAPAGERKIRLLKKLGRGDEALRLAEQILSDPLSDASEADFARDELAKAQDTRRSRGTTRKLKTAERVILDWQAYATPEAAAIAHYESQGFGARFTENYFWNSLFGLTLWDFIHSKNLSYHFPLQVGSREKLFQFAESSKLELAEHFFRLSDSEFFLRHTQRIADEKFGTVNAFVSWHEELLAEIHLMHGIIGWPKLQAVLKIMTAGKAERGRGFPDLFVWSSDRYFFVEVKSPTDKLSSYQLRWLDLFEQIDLPARVLHIKNI